MHSVCSGTVNSNKSALIDPPFQFLSLDSGAPGSSCSDLTRARRLGAKEPQFEIVIVTRFVFVDVCSMHFKAPLAGLSTILGLAALENCHFFPVDPLSSLYSRKLLCSKAPTLSELIFTQKNTMAAFEFCFTVDASFTRSP